MTINTTSIHNMTKSTSVPAAMQEKFGAITQATDAFCDQYLNDQYKLLIRQALAALCRKRPSPLQSGKANSWAAGAVHALGMANFLFDATQTPHIAAGGTRNRFCQRADPLCAGSQERLAAKMDPKPLEAAAPAAALPVFHYRWLPTIALEAGMVIARPVVGLTGVRETMYLAIGSQLTASTIAQMVVKGVECVAVLDPLPTEYSDDGPSIARFETRLGEIFGPQPNAACQALMQALRLARPTLC
jgi:hypothetical protein